MCSNTTAVLSRKNIPCAPIVLQQSVGPFVCRHRTSSFKRQWLAVRRPAERKPSCPMVTETRIRSFGWYDAALSRTRKGGGARQSIFLPAMEWEHRASSSEIVHFSVFLPRLRVLIPHGVLQERIGPFFISSCI